MGKVSREELMFTQLIIRAGLLTIEQYQEALEARSQVAKSTGVHKPLDEIIVARGYLSAKVVENIRQKVAFKPPTQTVLPAATAKSNLQNNLSLMCDVLDNPPAPEGYRLAEKLGEGAMGAVFKGQSLQDNSAVAIKFLDPRYNKNVEWVRRFLREAEAIKHLQHPHIVKAMGSGEHKGYYYLIMEFIPGESVLKILEAQHRLPQLRALAITQQIAQALQYAHAKGIIHRDIKPENILVEYDCAKLCDFGLVRSIESDTMMTRVGSFIGTPHYVSPEQARGLEDIDCRTDIYSLGCTLYHMLVGQPPYPQDNPVVVLTAQATQPFPDPLVLAPELRPKVVSLIRKMTVKDRAMRMANCDLLLAAMDDAVSQLQNPLSETSEAGDREVGAEGDGADPDKRNRRAPARAGQRNTKRRLQDSSANNSKRSRETSSSLPSLKKLRESGNVPAAHPQPQQQLWLQAIWSIMTVAAIAMIAYAIWLSSRK